MKNTSEYKCLYGCHNHNEGEPNVCGEQPHIYIAPMKNTSEEIEKVTIKVTFQPGQLLFWGLVILGIGYLMGKF